MQPRNGTTGNPGLGLIGTRGAVGNPCHARGVVGNPGLGPLATHAMQGALAGCVGPHCASDTVPFVGARLPPLAIDAVNNLQRCLQSAIPAMVIGRSNLMQRIAKRCTGSPYNPVQLLSCITNPFGSGSCLMISPCSHLPMPQGPALFASCDSPVRCWPGALGVLTLEDLCVGITQLDGDIALQLVLKTHCLHP